MTRLQLQILILVSLLLQAGIGLIIQGALTAAFLAASFFLKPKSKIAGSKGANIPIQNSDYGGMIPIIYGVARVGGNIVWASELRKTIETETVGGKGLGGQSVDTPVFDVDLAVMIAKGRVSDIRRIWADGKTIFDQTGASEITSIQNLNFRLLNGDPNQEPDSLIQTDVDGRLGVGSTPAYRGRSIVVFEKLFLKDFGNRIPNLSFEIVADNDAASAATPTVILQDGSIFTKNTNQNVTHPDWDRGLLFMGGDGSFGSDALRTAVTTISTKQLLRVLSIRDSDGGGAVDPATGDVLSKTQASAEISRWDPITGVIKAQANLGIGAFQGGKNYCHNPNSFPISTVFFGKMRTTVTPTEFRYQVIDTEINLIASVDRPDSTYVLTTPTASKDGSSYAAFVNTTEMRMYALGVKSSNLAVSSLPAFQVPPLPAAGQGFVNFGLLETLTPATFGGTLFDITDTPQIVYDRGSGDIVIFFTMDGNDWASRYTPGTGVVWTSEMPFRPTGQCAAHSRVTGKAFGFISQDQKIALLDITTGELDQIFDGTITVANLPAAGIFLGGDIDMFFWDEKTFSFYGTPDTTVLSNSRVRRIRLDISSSIVGTSLADIVSDISVEAGYEIISDYDVSELVNLNVPGYPLLEQQTARDAMQPLSDIYFFDGIESDDKLRYRTRGRASSAVLTEDGLIELNSEGQLFGRTRVQEVELPRSVQITSTDPQNSYQQATQQAARVGFPNPTNRSNNQESISVPLILDQDFARQSAEKLLYSAWNDRNGYEFRTNWEFLILDPSDVLTITFDDGFSTDVRLEEANSGTDFSVEIKGVGEGPGQYSSSILGETSSSLQVTIPSVENSQLFLLDVPLLQDVDAPSAGISRMYWAGNSINPMSWVGGLLYESDNLSTFQVSGATNNPASWGVLINSLAPPSSPWSWDTVNTINLVVQSGIDNFSSSTDDLVLSGANAIALIRDGASRQVEIIQFVNVVVETDGTLTLSRLLRGRRGTEVFGETNHIAGQKVVLLTTSAVNSYLDPASEVSNPHFYRLVTTGQNFADISNISYTPDGRSLRPYAPTQQTAVTNASDIDLAAVRRTRINGDLTDGTGVVPLNEDTEQYELEILDMPGGSVLRTITALSTPFYKYLSADITTDFGSPPANLTVKWYQVSASVGRGFTSEVTIEVA